MTDKLEPGWADKYVRPEPPASKRRIPRRVSVDHDYQCGLNGSRKGGANVVRKLDRVLGKPEDE